jgi:hypothetical protein
VFIPAAAELRIGCRLEHPRDCQEENAVAFEGYLVANFTAASDSGAKLSSIASQVDGFPKSTDVRPLVLFISLNFWFKDSFAC